MELVCVPFRDASFRHSEEDYVVVMVVVRCARNPVARQVHNGETSVHPMGAASNANSVNALVSLVAVACVRDTAVNVDAKSRIKRSHLAL